MVNNVYQLKHIQLTKHIHYCIHKIYHVYYTTQWIFIILSKFSHMPVTSPNQNWMRVADTVKRFCHLFLWRGEFYFDMVGNFEENYPKLQCIGKIDYFLPWSLLLSIYFFLDSVKLCYLQTKKHAVTSLDNAHSITWYNKKGVEIEERQNRCHDGVWAGLWTLCCKHNHWWCLNS